MRPSIRSLLLVALLLGAIPSAASAASPWRSYSETQSIPLEPARAAEVLPMRTPPADEPDPDDVEDCMAQEGADTEQGHVRSRYLWCLRSIARLVQANGDQARIHYQIVG